MSSTGKVRASVAAVACLVIVGAAGCAASKLGRMAAREEAAKKTQGAPLLDRSNIPVALLFRDQETGKIYDALSKATGITFLYDPKLDLKKRISIELTNVPFEKAMEALMLASKHFFKVIDENTIMIADDNQQKRKEYEDGVIKTFFLSNADVKEVRSLLRTMLAKPRPPEVQFKYVGLVGDIRVPLGVFMDGNTLFLARKGQVVREKFRIIEVGVAWVDVGWVDPQFKDVSPKRIDLGS